MATKRRTTKPVSTDLKALRASLRAAEERGESAVRPVYRAMDRAAKSVFARSRSR